MKRKLLIFLIIILILGGGGFLGYNYLYNKFIKKPGDSKTPDPTANWEIYKSEGYKFSIKYPKDWEMIEKPNKDAPLSGESINILPPLPEELKDGKQLKIYVNVYEDEDFLLNWIETENKHYEMEFLEWAQFGKNKFAKVETPEFKDSVSFVTAANDTIYEINTQAYPPDTADKSFNEKLTKDIEFMLMNFKILD
ncbi:MAG: hypothetical protein GTN40_04625 [Candidatus Aenigmarchaeota archaeon]|nr:hypothetical protein [Candidatus Aenigmarchaeota archaeon]